DKWEIRALYLAPPASGDWDKVREVIAILDADGDEWGCAAKLTAALPESRPAQDADAKDAARYRWLRDTPWFGTSLEPVIAQQRNAHWDAAIDDAMAREAGNV